MRSLRGVSAYWIKCACKRTYARLQPKPGADAGRLKFLIWDERTGVAFGYAGGRRALSAVTAVPEIVYGLSSQVLLQYSTPVFRA